MRGTANPGAEVLRRRSALNWLQTNCDLKQQPRSYDSWTECISSVEVASAPVQPYPDPGHAFAYLHRMQRVAALLQRTQAIEHKSHM